MTRSLFPARGAQAPPLVMEVKRAITPADLRLLAEGAPKIGTPIIQKLRAIHHRQAILLAEGRPVGEVAAIVGCTPQRVSDLLKDPAFADLMAYYKDQVLSAMLGDAARLKDKIVDVGEMAVDELRERLETAPKSIPISEIRKIAEFAMDRTVAPPQAAPTSAVAPAAVTINFGTGLRPERPAAPVIDGEVAEGAEGAEGPTPDSRNRS